MVFMGLRYHMLFRVHYFSSDFKQAWMWYN